LPGVLLNKSVSENSALFFKLLVCLIALEAALLVSCVTGGTGSPPPSAVYLTDRSKYVLLPPGDIERPLDMVQQISAIYSGRDYLLNAWVKADESEITMSVFNSFGAGMGELVYRQGLVAFSSGAFPSSLKAEYIVADFQLCFYGTKEVAGALKKGGLSLETENDGRGREIRRIADEKSTIIEIEKTAGAVRYVNKLRGYSYTLEGEF
jgi:hypothetical protein